MSGATVTFGEQVATFGEQVAIVGPQSLITTVATRRGSIGRTSIGLARIGTARVQVAALGQVSQSPPWLDVIKQQNNSEAASDK